MSSIITKYKDIPHHQDLVPVPEEYRNQMAILHTGGSDCVLLVTDDAVKDAVLRARAHTSQKGFNLKQKFVAGREIIAEINSDNSRGLSELDSKATDDSKVLVHFRKIINTAKARQATDVHIVVTAKESVIKLRVRGRMVVLDRRASAFLMDMCRAIYTVMGQDDSKESTFEAKRYQDGQIPFSDDLMLRYAHMPIYPSGLKVVLRLLPINRSNNFTTMKMLGYSELHERTIYLAAKKPQGGIFVAGTTGSGKSTTLQNLIKQYIHRTGGRKNVITIENPVEYLIPGANQVSLILDENERDPFAPAIRAAMRSDPDLLMIGEVRDQESASLLKRAIQSGHQVCTTIHAASAFDIIPRLESLGIDRNTMASPNFISALVYQKLVPTLCKHCRIEMKEAVEEKAVSESDIHRLMRLLPTERFTKANIYFERHGGCPKCDHLGVDNMTVCAETILLDDPILRCIRDGNDLEALRLWQRSRNKQGALDGYGCTAFEHGVHKLLAGEISLSALEESFGDISLHEILADQKIEGIEIDDMKISSLAFEGELEGQGQEYLTHAIS